MSSILNWEPSKKAGEFASAAGNYRIVPDANGFTLVSNRDQTVEGKTWKKQFTSLAAAMAFPRIRESRQEVFVYKVSQAIKEASKTRQKQLRREFSTELQLIGLFAEGYVTDEDRLTGNRRLNALARELAVAERL
jgi:hypothetical protein